jgi:hypothetical protein
MNFAYINLQCFVATFSSSSHSLFSLPKRDSSTAYVALASVFQKRQEAHSMFSACFQNWDCDATMRSPLFQKSLPSERWRPQSCRSSAYARNSRSQNRQLQQSCFRHFSKRFTAPWDVLVLGKIGRHSLHP